MLLDTNIIIELFKGNQLVLRNFEASSSPKIPFAVLGELYLGAYRSANPIKHLDQIARFLKKCSVVYGDDETARYYGQVKTALLKKGKPIPENDMWIAAIAIQHNDILITNDGHFAEVEKVKTDSW